MTPPSRTLADTLALAGQWLALEAGRAPARAPGASRRLALFAWSLPPSTNPGVYRPLSFLQHGVQRGWTIDAFCGEPPANQRENGEELLARVPAEATLHAVPASSKVPSYRFFPRVDGGFANAIAFARAARHALQATPPDVVLASGPPFFVFVAALWTARHFRVPLVLDYRDEWSECPFDFVDKSGNDVHWERRCLAAAAAVLFTTASHRRHQVAKFAGLAPACAHVVANGWEAGDFPPVAGPRTAPTGARWTLAHVGTLAGHTPPDAFLAALDGAVARDAGLRDRLRVQFIGRRSAEASAALRAFGAPEMIEVVDHVGKGEAARRMRAADALLLIAVEDLARYLPGKLFDYVAAGRPVLVFGHPGEASDLVTRLGVGVVCHPPTAERLSAALSELAGGEAQADEGRIRAWLAAHRRDALAEQAFRILDGVVAQGGTRCA